jgi:hypothetical protein
MDLSSALGSGGLTQILPVILSLRRSGILHPSSGRVDKPCLVLQGMPGEELRDKADKLERRL